MVFSSPALPGLRPSNSSDESVLISLSSESAWIESRACRRAARGFGEHAARKMGRARTLRLMCLNTGYRKRKRLAEAPGVCLVTPAIFVAGAFGGRTAASRPLSSTECPMALRATQSNEDAGTAGGADTVVTIARRIRP